MNGKVVEGVSDLDAFADRKMNTNGRASQVSSLQRRHEVPLVELSLENVTYAPVTKSAEKGNLASKKRTTVLQNIRTNIAPYQLTAWMGPSGSGKTSLISVVADLINPGDLDDESRICVNGEEGRIPKRLVGVVWQDDLLMSNLTVEENIYFAARLKTPSDVSDAEVQEIVQVTVEELGLLHVRNRLVGSPLVRGVSGGERKRVSVAVELVVRPSLLLLDEPTSGLDATTAQSLVSTLKDLAGLGHSIAVVIHQPRTTIFNLFDHLLLLSHGRVLFDGEASKARGYLESCPTVAKLPPETGIADWMMDVIIGDQQRQGGGVLAKHWAQAICPSDAQREAVRAPKRMNSLKELHSVPKFTSNFWTQFKLLTQRTMKQQRGERLTAAALVLQVTYLFFTALFWWRMPDTTAWIFERNSLLFFIIIAQANGVVISAVTLFQRERAVLRRERAKKMYGVSSYFLAKTLADMSNNVLLPVLYGMTIYWTANFRLSVAAYFKFILAYYLTISTAQSMGLFLSIVIPSTQIALILAPPITLFFMIMGGFYIPFENMHAGYEWATWLSFARYGYSALVINEYEGRDIPCAEGEASIQIGLSESCPLPGEEVIAGLGINGVAEGFWFNVSLVILLQIVFRVAAYFILRRSK